MTRALPTLAFITLSALLFATVLTTAEAEQKRVDTLNQEQMHGHRQLNR